MHLPLSELTLEAFGQHVGSVTSPGPSLTASQLLQHGCAPCAEGFGICQMSLVLTKK